MKATIHIYSDDNMQPNDTIQLQDSSTIDMTVTVHNGHNEPRVSALFLMPDDARLLAQNLLEFADKVEQYNAKIDEENTCEKD